MSYIKINQEKAVDKIEIQKICPFGAIDVNDGKLVINAACKMCRLCTRKHSEIFEFVEEASKVSVDKSLWKGIAVFAEINQDGTIHPVTLELLGKAKELAEKVNYPVYAVIMGENVQNAAEKLLYYGVDEVFLYENAALKMFRIEPYTNVMEDFIRKVHPSVILVGGTVNGRSLAPRTAARFRTGLTADCTMLDISETTDLDQIRPAYGGNIMAHINTPNQRPQFATVRNKVFSVPPRSEKIHGKITKCAISAEKLKSGIEIIDVQRKALKKGIEDAEVLIVAGRGIQKKEDLRLLRELADLLNGKVASTRAVVETGWMDPEYQIGLSGRTVKPKLLIACGVSGAIQFVSGMNQSECIVAINSDPEAPIFKVAHIGITGDLYSIVPKLIQNLKELKMQGETEL